MKKPRIELFYLPAGTTEFATAGWYWIDYTNVKQQLVYEGGPFSSKAEAEDHLQEYLSK